MRIINFLLGLGLVYFVVVQVNDPDAVLWMFYYGVPCGWAFAAAGKPVQVDAAPARHWLRGCVLVWLGLVIFYWPQMPNFWVKEVWMQEETAREGMGLMIAWAAMVVAAASTWRRSAPAAATSAGDGTAASVGSAG